MGMGERDGNVMMGKEIALILIYVNHINTSEICIYPFSIEQEA